MQIGVKLDNRSSNQEKGQAQRQRLLKCWPEAFHPTLQHWDHWLRVEKNYSPHTVLNYGQDLQAFAVFLTQHMEEEPALIQLQDLTIRDFRAFLAHRITLGINVRSMARTLSTLRTFYRFLKKNYSVNNQAIFELQRPRLPKVLPRPLRLEEIKAFFAQLEIFFQAEEWVKRRNIAIFMILYGGGLRIQEALNLTIQQVVKTDYLPVLGKGGKQRLVPLLPVVKTAIEEYLMLRPLGVADTDPLLFIGVKGKPLQAAVVQRFMQQVRRQLGLPENATPHSLRHSFATHLLQRHADLRSIQELMGHASLGSSQRYLDLDLANLQATYQAAHPRAKPLTSPSK